MYPQNIRLILHNLIEFIMHASMQTITMSIMQQKVNF